MKTLLLILCLTPVLAFGQTHPIDRSDKDVDLRMSNPNDIFMCGTGLTVVGTGMSIGTIFFMDNKADDNAAKYILISTGSAISITGIILQVIAYKRATKQKRLYIDNGAAAFKF